MIPVGDHNRTITAARTPRAAASRTPKKERGAREKSSAFVTLKLFSIDDRFELTTCAAFHIF